MASVVTPNQKIYLDPYVLQKPFDNRSVYSSIYLSPDFNNIHQLFGDGTVLRGLEVTNYSIDADGIVEIRVGTGYAIVSLVRVAVLSQSVLTMNVSGYQPTGKLALLLEYNYLERLTPGVARLKLVYVDSTGEPDPMITGSFCLLNVFTFTRNPYTISMYRGRNLFINGRYYNIRELGHIYTTGLKAVCETRVISSEDIEAGYFLLFRQPVNPLAVELIDADSGLRYSPLAGSSLPDFVVDGAAVYISGSNLANTISNGDRLLIKYVISGG